MTVTVFSHPTCTSCKDALRAARELEGERSDVEVEMVSLASERGRERAEEEGVLVVPTVVVGEERVQAAPSRGELEALVEAAG